MLGHIGKVELQTLAKQASDHHCSRGVPLTDAVSKVLSGRDDLTDEHVQRVVEFANNASFTRMFKEAMGPHRLVNFDHGPADPVAVLERVRGPKEVVMKTAEYARGLESFELFHDEGLAKVASESAPSVDVEMRDYSALRDAVARAEHELGALQVRYDSSIDGLCKEARAAINVGWSPVDIAEALDQVSPNATFTKLALRHLSDHLQDTPAVPFTKTAGRRVVRADHPLCFAFEGLVKSAMDFYEMAGATEKLRGTLRRAAPVMKEMLQ